MTTKWKSKNIAYLFENEVILHLLFAVVMYSAWQVDNSIVIVYSSISSFVRLSEVSQTAVQYDVDALQYGTV